MRYRHKEGVVKIFSWKNLENRTILEMDIVIHLAGKAHDTKHPRIWKLNRNFMEKCAKIGGILHLPLNTERLRKLTENYVVSNKKIKTAIDIERMPISARERLLKTIRSFEGKK